MHCLSAQTWIQALSSRSLLTLLSAASLWAALIPPAHSEELRSDPLSGQEREMVATWGRELARWPQYCVGRGEGAPGPLSGCGSRAAATQARWALLRQRRITGHGGLSLGLGGRALLSPRAWPELPQRVLQDSEDRGALLNERAWRLALSFESLMSTGDAGWLLPLWREMATLSAELSVECVTDPLASEPCVSALYWIARVAQTPWAEAEASLFPKTLPQGSALDNRAAWIAHWERLGAWVQALTSPAIKSSAARCEPERCARAQLLAAVTLSERALSAERLKWASSPERFSPAPPAQATSPLTPLQALAAAQLAASSGARAQGQRAHQLIRALMSAYLKSGRDRDLRTQLALDGLWAISALWERRERDPKLRLPVGGLGLSYEPRLWRLRSQEQRLQVKPLDASGELAQGMFSKIKVRDRDGVRGMYFVRPGGVEVLESELDLERPELLRVAYTSDFLISYALTPHHQRALIVGLGGGGMLHALKAYDPELELDVVEIDPVVVQLAQEYFGVNETPANIITRDGFEQLRDPEVSPYDVIYMDAFLQPSEETDSTGAPLRLRTVEFLREVRQRLSPQGVLLINLNEHPQVARDVRSIRAAFSSSLIWRVPQTGNLIVAAFNSAAPSPQTLSLWASRAEARLKSPVSLSPILLRALSSEGL